MRMYIESIAFAEDMFHISCGSLCFVHDLFVFGMVYEMCASVARCFIVICAHSAPSQAS